MKKILILPAWVKSFKFYNEGQIAYKIGKVDEEAMQADTVAGLSLGALILLDSYKQVAGKIILINPPLPKRNLATWFYKWACFALREGIFSHKRVNYVINPSNFVAALTYCIRLLNIDFSGILDQIPKDKIVVIRGKKDDFFCDARAVEFLQAKGIRIIEAEGGHNLSPDMEDIILYRV